MSFFFIRFWTKSWILWKNEFSIQVVLVVAIGMVESWFRIACRTKSLLYLCRRAELTDCLYWCDGIANPVSKRHFHTCCGSLPESFSRSFERSYQNRPFQYSSVLYLVCDWLSFPSLDTVYSLPRRQSSGASHLSRNFGSWIGEQILIGRIWTGWRRFPRDWWWVEGVHFAHQQKTMKQEHLSYFSFV